MKKLLVEFAGLRSALFALALIAALAAFAKEKVVFDTDIATYTNVTVSVDVAKGGLTSVDAKPNPAFGLLKVATSVDARAFDDALTNVVTRAFRANVEADRTFETVFLDEPGLWERIGSYHGVPSVKRDGVSVGGTRAARGVVACSPNALIVGLHGEAKRFTAKVGLRDATSPSVVRFKVWREKELVWESTDIQSNTPPQAVSVDLTDARYLKLEMTASQFFTKGWGVWAEAALEMNPGKRPTDVAALSRQLGILTPSAAKTPRINSAPVFGVRPGNPVFYRVPVTGERPLTVEVEGLEKVPGLTFDPVTRRLGGAVASGGDYPLTFRARNGHGTAEKPFVLRVGNRLALTPPLGWNSWNAFATAIDGVKVRRTAALMESLGLVDHGWAYLTIDDGWQLKAKDFPPDARRTADGTVKSNALFGDMKALADAVHTHGLRFGIYSSPGPTTCGGYEGSWRHEFQDAKTYAQWGVDYLKYDYCSYGQVAYGEGLDRDIFPYALMSRALAASGRDIVHSLCQQGRGNVSEWGASIGGHCWRTTPDRFDFWSDVVSIMDHHATIWRHAGPGSWNDPDMMLVGKTIWGVRCGFGGTRLTPNEQYTHVSIWAMTCAPMMIGCDLDGIDDFTLSLLTNDEVLEINQDVLGAAAAPIDDDGDLRIWAKPMSDGSVAAALVNLSPLESEGRFCFVRNGMTGAWRARDVWRQQELGSFEKCFRTSVPGHATTLLRLWPVGAAGIEKGLSDIRDNYWRRGIEAHRPLGGQLKPGVRSDVDCGCL